MEIFESFIPIFTTAQTSRLRMSHLEEIKKPIKREMQRFEKHFRFSMNSNIPLLNIITNYILRIKGKQIAPYWRQDIPNGGCGLCDQGII